MRPVRIGITDETVRARSGAMSNMAGAITLTPRLPTVGHLLRALFNDEAKTRPDYSGTGSIMLQPSLGGYHLLEVREEEPWVPEPGVYMASDGEVELGLHREPFCAGLWAGNGLVAFKTTLDGHGTVAINAPGPVEIVDVEDGDLRVQGRLVLGRTGGLKFSSQSSTRFPRNLISGQKRLRVFSGSGRALVCWTPYWNQHMYSQMTGENIERSLFE